MKKIQFLKAGLSIGITMALLVAWATSASAATTTIFKTKKNGKTIICGLVNGKYVPGSGSAAKFTATADALKGLKGKTDKKSKNKVKQLKDYQKLAAAVCRKGPVTAKPTPTPTKGGGGSTGNEAAGQSTFNSKCASCHSASEFRGKSAANLQTSHTGLSSSEAANLAAFVNK